jgi:hypothetical protein
MTNETKYLVIVEDITGTSNEYFPTKARAERFMGWMQTSTSLYLAKWDEEMEAHMNIDSKFTITEY